MFRNLAFVVGYPVVLVLFTAGAVPAAQYGTAEEAKAMNTFEADEHLLASAP